MGGEKSRRHLPLRAAKSPNDIADRISHRLKLLALNCSHSCRACRGCDDRASGRSPASTDVRTTRSSYASDWLPCSPAPLLPCRQPTGLSTPSLLRERPALSDQRPLTPPTPVTRRTRTSAGDPNPTSTLVTSHGGWSPAIVTGPTRCTRNWIPVPALQLGIDTLAKSSRAACVDPTFFRMLCATTFVMLQTPAAGFVQGGLVRRKNTMSVIGQSFIGVVIGSILWYAPSRRYSRPPFIHRTSNVNPPAPSLGYYL